MAEHPQQQQSNFQDLRSFQLVVKKSFIAYSILFPLGHNCEVDIDDCNPNPCQNNGNCTDEVDDFKCDCSTSETPKTGKTCEIHDYCKEYRDRFSRDPCCSDNWPNAIKGSCKNEDQQYTCECKDDTWEGQHCTKKKVSTYTNLVYCF